jgi:diadenylate cyclase
VSEAIAAFRWRDVLDIGLVAIVVYRILVMFRGTRAVQMLVGLACLVAGSLLARRLELYSTQWILDNFWSFWVIAVVVLFQPELRRALARVGEGRLVTGLLSPSRAERAHVIDEIVDAVESLTARRIGALIVMERAAGLRQYAELGVAIDGRVSADLLVSVFLPYSPLHDGAVFVRGSRLVAAGCFLPLSRNLQIARSLGTRHRAALGISEETDAVAVAVSEETGRVTIAVGGHIETVRDLGGLRSRLDDLVGALAPVRGGGGVRGAWRRLLFRAPDSAA